MSKPNVSPIPTLLFNITNLEGAGEEEQRQPGGFGCLIFERRQESIIAGDDIRIVEIDKDTLINVINLDSFGPL